MTKLEQLVTILEGRRVWIQTHDFPDPDAISSAFALQYLLRLHGVESTLCYCGKVDKVNIRRMLELLEIPIKSIDDYKPDEKDAVITIDGQKDNSNFTDICGEEIACIDHHPWVTKYQYAFVDQRIVGACATIITHYCMEAGLTLPREVATALLYGIKMDTLNFCNGVQKEDIEAFGYLHGMADHQLITDLDNNVMEISDLRAYGAAIQDVVIYERMGFAHIPFDCPDGLIAQVSNFILSLDAVDVSVIYAERGGGLKFSVRSEIGWLNAGQLINLALRDIGNGGGHPTMAGGLVFASRMDSLGRSYDVPIRDRFLSVFNEIKEKAREAGICTE